MFESLAALIRLRRHERNLTQDRLAKMAGVSRRQLSLLEDGANVSLQFLVKVARALELTELPVAELRVRSVEPDFTSVIHAADAVVTAQRVMGRFVDSAQELDDAGATLQAIISRSLDPNVSTQAVVDAAQRLEKGELGAAPGVQTDRARAKRQKSADKPAERGRGR